MQESAEVAEEQVAKAELAALQSAHLVPLRK